MHYYVCIMDNRADNEIKYRELVSNPSKCECELGQGWKENRCWCYEADTTRLLRVRIQTFGHDKSLGFRSCGKWSEMNSQQIKVNNRE